MTGHVVITRAAMIGLVVSYLFLLVALGWIVKVSRDEHSQQQQQTVLLNDLCRNQKLQREFLIGVAINQPGIDTRLLNIIQQSLNQLPSKCP